MPWKETDVREERIQFVVSAVAREGSMSDLCRQYGITRKTGYKWLHRYRQVGSVADLGEHSRRPHSSPNRTPESIEERVEAIRVETGWGGRKIQCLLAREGIYLSRSTVDRILKRRGLVERRVRQRSALRRFERSRPNELWQMDFKGPFPLIGTGQCHPLSVIDDHSRYALGLDALANQQSDPVQQCLMGHFERYGLPEAMLMDHGSPWWGSTNGYGLTRLGVFLVRQGIDLIYGGVGHPQTQGKVERFHRTLGASMSRRPLPRSLPGYQAAFASFRSEYNEIRPHESLADKTPAQRYRPSRRSFCADPPDWEYPAGSEVLTVSGNGCIYIGNRYRFVCEALTGQQVRCQRFGDRVLVSYRHMQIRELNLVSGKTTAVVSPLTAKP